MKGITDEIKFELDLPVRKEWQDVERLRTSVLGCLSIMFQNTDFCEMVSMVSGELLENAIKYGDWTGHHSSFRLRVVGSNRQVTIEVSNPVAADSASVRAVLETLTWIKGMPSPAEAYAVRMRAAAEAGGETSSLGLARIAYEGGCDLHAFVDTGNILVVRAVCAP